MTVIVAAGMKRTRRGITQTKEETREKQEREKRKERLRIKMEIITYRVIFSK